MSRIFISRQGKLIPTRGLDDWEALHRNKKHWKPRHSAMAVARSWEAAAGSSATMPNLPPEIASLLGKDSELLRAIPEHTTPMPGKGRPSQSDVFALVREGENTIALAVVATVSEPFGDRLEKWLSLPRASSREIENRQERLDGICKHLGLLPQKLPDDLRYQLLHRTVAAVIEMERHKADKAAMIVQSFSPRTPPQDDPRFKDFEYFAKELFGMQAKPDHAEAYNGLPCGKPLMIGWAVGDKSFL